MLWNIHHTRIPPFFRVRTVQSSYLHDAWSAKNINQGNTWFMHRCAWFICTVTHSHSNRHFGWWSSRPGTLVFQPRGSGRHCDTNVAPLCLYAPLKPLSVQPSSCCQNNPFMLMPSTRGFWDAINVHSFPTCMFAAPEMLIAAGGRYCSPLIVFFKSAVDKRVKNKAVLEGKYFFIFPAWISFPSKYLFIGRRPGWGLATVRTLEGISTLLQIYQKLLNSSACYQASMHQ